MIEGAFWGVHAGKTGDADEIFLKKNQVALGWCKVSDLSALVQERDAFKSELQKVYPDKKQGWYRIAAGQLFRFVNEMKEGDFVIYPSKSDRQIHIGEVVGPYQFVAKNARTYPHRRSVKWIKKCARTRFSQGALHEIGSALSFFQVKNYADEVVAVLGGAISVQEQDDEEAVSYIANEIEQSTRDYILKTLARELKGHGLSYFVEHLLNAMGYRTRVASPGPDGGVDIIAHRDELGFEPPIIKVQVKSSEKPISREVVASLMGVLEQDDRGMFVTLGAFSNPARNSVRNKSNIRLVDGDDLVGLILQHYEKFDAKYKGMLPLKRVYVPEALDDE